MGNGRQLEWKAEVEEWMVSSFELCASAAGRGTSEEGIVNSEEVANEELKMSFCCARARRGDHAAAQGYQKPEAVLARVAGLGCGWRVRCCEGGNLRPRDARILTLV